MWSLYINLVSLTTSLIVLLAFFLIPARTKERNIYLIVLLLAIVVHSISELFFHFQFYSIVIFSVFATSMVVILGPALYFYCRNLFEMPTKGFLWHILISNIGLCIIWGLVLSRQYLVPQWLLSTYYSTILFGYLLAVLNLLNKQKPKQHASWLKTIGVGSGVLIILHLVEVVWINLKLESAAEIAVINTSVQNIFTTLFLLIVIRQIIKSPQTFSRVQIRIPYKINSVEFDQEELDSILSYVEGKKAYRNPDLKILSISEETGLNSGQISKIVNNTFQKNINDWLNDYRIEEAKEYLLESSLTIQEIYFEVGFNSKSAFNNAFKKRLGDTPTGYRAKLVSNHE